MARLFAALLLLLAGAARAELALPADSRLVAQGQDRVTSVIDGDTVQLESGYQVRLVGLQAPKLSLGREGVRDWPLARQSAEALAGMILGRRVFLYAGGQTRDRYGRILAHLVREDGVWVQGQMLIEGHARVYSFPDNRALVLPMLEAERRARANRRGIWGESFYRVRTPDSLERDTGSFQIVQGTVLAAQGARGTGWLNFGTDRTTDFTVRIPVKARKSFTEAKIRIPDLAGKQIRVRGWIDKRNGPEITVTHPEQIEVLEP